MTLNLTNTLLNIFFRCDVCYLLSKIFRSYYNQKAFKKVMEQFSHDLTLALEETSRCGRRWGMRRRTRSTGNLRKYCGS